LLLSRLSPVSAVVSSDACQHHRDDEAFVLFCVQPSKNIRADALIHILRPPGPFISYLPAGAYTSIHCTNVSVNCPPFAHAPSVSVIVPPSEVGTRQSTWKVAV
jgi:hypothetical protein